MPPRYLLLIPMVLLAFDQTRLVKTKAAEGITIYIPRGWRPMDELDFTERYPSVRAPLAAYTNDERTVDFSVNISATQWRPGDEELAQEFFKASIRNLFDRVDILQEGIREIKGKRYIYVEFESRVNGSRDDDALRSPVVKYSYVQYHIMPGRTLVFSFNCPARERENWQSTADSMMKSVRLK